MTTETDPKPAHRMTTEELMHRLLTGRECMGDTDATRLIAELVRNTRREDAEDLANDAEQLGPDCHRTAGLRSAAMLLRGKADAAYAAAVSGVR